MKTYLMTAAAVVGLAVGGFAYDHANNGKSECMKACVKAAQEHRDKCMTDYEAGSEEQRSCLADVQEHMKDCAEGCRDTAK